MRDLDAIGEICERIVGDPGQLELEAFVMEVESMDYLLENDVFKGAGTHSSFGIGIRAIQNKQMGFAFTDGDSPRDIKRCIQDARKMSRIAPKLKGFQFPEEAKAPEVWGLFDKRLTEMKPREAVEILEEATDACLEQHEDLSVTRGTFNITTRRVGIFNTSGNKALDEGTHGKIDLNCILDTGTQKSTGFSFQTVRKKEFDPEAVGVDAAGLAQMSIDPVKVDSGEKAVILSPEGGVGIYEFIMGPALCGDVFMRGDSIYSDRKEEKIMDDLVTVVDDGRLTGGVWSSHFDDEGVPSRRNTLVEDGIMKKQMHSVTSSAPYYRKSTGNAVRTERHSSSKSYKSMPTVRPRNLCIISDYPSEFGDLIADVGNGLLIHETMGAHTANPSSGDFSVLVTMGWLIEDGELKAAIKPGMLSGNLPNMLSEIIGIDEENKIMRGTLSASGFALPNVAYPKAMWTS